MSAQPDMAQRMAAVTSYHQRTKHQLGRYAAAAGFLDWATQPQPFRFFEGAPRIELPLKSAGSRAPYDTLYQPVGGQALDLSRQSLGGLLELSLGLSAWKRYGAAEWSLRMNPSSGNLHPTECYLLLPAVNDLPAGVVHYNPLLHCLEMRAELAPQGNGLPAAPPGLALILSSIHWREAWKYGERAFRYCHHDVGHALGALRFSTVLAGWRLLLLPEVADASLERILGFDRIDWPPGEEEHADCLCWLSATSVEPESVVTWMQGLRAPVYRHAPNRLSPQTEDWAVIGEIAKATRSPGFSGNRRFPMAAGAASSAPASEAEEVIRKRRSAQAYDPANSTVGLESFLRMLARTLPADAPPFDCLPLPPSVHLALFVHRVEALAPGLYLLLRNPDHLDELQRRLDPAFLWDPVAAAAPLYRLATGNYRSLAAAISCHQSIAGDSAFSLGMLARFRPLLEPAPWLYPRLYWEAGLIGQVLYLEAEARGLRGTGIGCFFDDEMHRLLGLEDDYWQDIYHFTVGLPKEDPRIQTRPPYHHLNPGVG